MKITTIHRWMSGLAIAALLICPHFANAAQGDCGQPSSTGPKPTTTDALSVLKSAVKGSGCDECVCDVNGSGGATPITATDALVTLGVAVGKDLQLQCPPCGTTTTSSSTTTCYWFCSTSTSTTLSSPTTTTTTTTLGGQPALAAGDFPGVTPCSDRDTLPDDPTFLTAITNAVEADNVVNFTQYDTDGLPEICGLADADNALDPGNVPWDPAENNEITVCNPFPGNVVDFFNNVPLGHGPDLCQTGNNTSTLAMPRAGTYRKDACIEHGGNAYRVRTRMSVSGASVDQMFANLGIGRSDLKACDGTTEIATQAQAKAFLTANPRSFDVAIKSATCNGGVEHLSVTAEIICVNKLAGPCPPADIACF